MSFLQYLKDTRGELRHVAWPTRLQTIVYTILVIALSLLVAAYLGLFDFLFTNGLKNVTEIMTERFPAQESVQVGTAPAFSTPQIEITPAAPVELNVGPNEEQQ